MISKEIVQQTIEALEDYIDFLPMNAAQAAQTQSLLNFWRLYLNFMPKEDETHVG